MVYDDLIMTIDSDAEDVVEVAPKLSKVKGKATDTKKSAAVTRKVKIVDEALVDEKDTLNPEFTFDVVGDVYDEALNGKDALGDLVKGSKRVRAAIPCG